ncbi:probable purine permease 5 [Euphorbia lathyris]|uniref:probable purine permease 5 n=1 Tax=Euphorbia lathyris TaxID=212925 RepID=UPI00331434F8
MEERKACASVLEKLSNWKNRAVEAYKRKAFSEWILLVLSSSGVLILAPASSLICRVYNKNGGTSKWIISWASVAGWPITALMLLPLYLFFNPVPTPLTLQLVLSYVGLGFLTTAHDLMFAYAYVYLPAPTATLLASSSLVFSCLFGYFIVNNKLNASIINATVIITAATTIIALDSDSDSERYDNVTDRQYIWGFFWVCFASLLHALIFALSELVFIKLHGRRSFHVVLEQQAMVSFFAFLFTTIGVVVNKDFEGMKSEAKTFVGGEDAYVKLLVWAAITFQLGTLGATGVVFLGSTVTAGIQNAVRDPITSIAAVVFLNDPLTGLKILSLIITFWGFACYIYGNPSSPKLSTT